MALSNKLISRMQNFFITSIGFFTNYNNNSSITRDLLLSLLERSMSYNTIAHFTNADIDNTIVTQLSVTSHPCRFCIVTAAIGNTGLIKVGGSTLIASTGFVLAAGENIELKINNTNLLYALATVDGEDVTVAYFN